MKNYLLFFSSHIDDFIASIELNWNEFYVHFSASDFFLHSRRPHCHVGQISNTILFHFVFFFLVYILGAFTSWTATGQHDNGFSLSLLSFQNASSSFMGWSLNRNMIQCVAKMLFVYFIFFLKIHPYQMSTAAVSVAVRAQCSLRARRNNKKKNGMKWKMGIQFIYVFDERTSDYTSWLQYKVVAFDFRSGITNTIRRCISQLRT